MPVWAGIQLKSSCFHRQCSFPTSTTSPPMEVLQVRPMQNGDKAGGGRRRNVITLSTWFQIFCLSTILKMRLKAPVKGLHPHHLPTFLITYLFSNIFCVPSGHLSWHFWPAECTFHIAVPLGILHLPLECSTFLCHFLSPLQNGQERHIQSSEENFCRKCQNSKMLSYCRCGSVWDKQKAREIPKGQPLPRPFTAEKETIDLITLLCMLLLFLKNKVIMYISMHILAIHNYTLGRSCFYVIVQGGSKIQAAGIRTRENGLRLRW